MMVRALTGGLALTAALVGAVLLPGGAAAAENTCADFTSQAAAQRAHAAGNARQRAVLDDDGDGVACEELLLPTSTTRPTATSSSAAPTSSSTAAPTSSSTAPTSTSTTATSTTNATTTATTSAAATTTPVDDRDCTDFATQAQAQAAFDADRTDPDRLDADGDGTACEDRFGTEGRQVAVVPNGGVATGGFRTP